MRPAGLSSFFFSSVLFPSSLSLLPCLCLLFLLLLCAAAFEHPGAVPASHTPELFPGNSGAHGNPQGICVPEGQRGGGWDPACSSHLQQ